MVFKFINQGTYGCVYSPNLPCNDETTNTKTKKWATKYISKLQIAASKTAVNEMSIGKRIQTIPQYKRYFAPLVQECQIDISIIDQEEIKKCNVISKAKTKEQMSNSHELRSSESGSFPPQAELGQGLQQLTQKVASLPDELAPHPSFISNKIRYVGHQSLGQYLNPMTQQTNVQIQLKKRMLETHIHLLKALALLEQLHIIHYDLKENNIMMDTVYGVPVIIDFGLSFQSDQLSSDNHEFFDLYEKYAPWPIEVMFLSLLAEKRFKKTSPLPVTDLIRVLDVYMSENEVFLYIEATFMIDFKNKVLNYLHGCEEKQQTVQQFMDELIQLTKSSWDNYSLAVIYHFFVENDFKIKEKENYKEYGNVLKSIILSFPDRATPQATLNLLTSKLGSLF